MKNIVYCITKEDRKYRVVTCEKLDNGKVLKLGGIIDNKVDRVYYDRSFATEECFKLNHPKKYKIKKIINGIGWGLCALALAFCTFISIVIVFGLWG